MQFWAECRFVLALQVAIVALLIVAVGGTALRGESTFRIVARSGYEPPLGPPDYAFNGSWRETPRINDAGRVIFSGTLERASDGDTRTSLWIGDALALTPIALADVLLPGAPDGNPVSSFDKFALAEDGSVAFLATTRSPVTFLSDGIWYGLPGALKLGAFEDAIDGDVQFMNLDFSNSVQIGDFENIVFDAQFERVSQPSQSGRGVFRGGRNGTLPVALNQEPAAGISGGVLYNNPTMVGITSNGVVTFYSPLTGPGIVPENAEGVWINDQNGTQLILRSGQAAPHAPGNIFHDVRAIRPMDERGRVLVYGRLTPSSNDTRVDTGYWAGPPDALQIVVREGDQAPGLSAGVRFADFDSASRQFHYWPTMSTNGNVAFAATLRDGGANVTNDRTVWTWIDGELSLIAREAQSAPGMPAGSVFVDFNGPQINARGQVLFVASAQVPGVFNPVNGIWATDGIGVVHLVAYAGQTIELPGGEMATISATMFPGPGTTAGALPGAFNDRGEIALSLLFTNAPSAVLVSQVVAVPEPATWVLAMLAALGMVRVSVARRR